MSGIKDCVSNSNYMEPLPKWRSVSTPTLLKNRCFTWNPPSYAKKKVYRIKSRHNYVHDDDSSSDSDGCSKKTPFSSNTINIQIINEIDWNVVKPIRAGIIVYNRDTYGNVRLCMGVDANYGEITDFGGGISYRRDKTTLLGALREFMEESHGIFGKYKPENLSDSLAIYNDYMIIIFLQINVDPLEVRKSFYSKLSPRSELCDVLWVTSDQFYALCREEKLISEDGYRKRGLYYRVRDLLKNTNFINLLP